MHILMIFLDGIGLGADDPAHNPFAAADLPTLHMLSGGQRWLANSQQHMGDRALFIPTDPRLGVPGRPQSGSNQATIVTGRNIPQHIGQHYGPKPNQATRDLLDADNLFKRLINAGKSAAILEAYPPRWHKGINSGKHIPASYQYAARSAGLRFFGKDDLYAGDALSGDWTGQGWREVLHFDDAPLHTPYAAGQHLAELAQRYDFTFFPHWLTDTTGHRGTLSDGVNLLTTVDRVMAGLLAAWDDQNGLVIITSDHGNLEDMSHGKHTENDVPTIVIGEQKPLFADLTDLTGFVPRILHLLEVPFER